MVRKIIFVRHAHSGQQHGVVDDFHRPLSKRGLREAKEIGEKIRKQKFIPRLIISSASLRTSSTAYIIAEQLGINPELIQKTNSIYESSPQEYLNLIAKQEESTDFIMFVGHNPAITSLAFYWEIETKGILPGEGFVCEGTAETWKDWLTSKKIKGEMIK
ncbi:MAG: phosphohistidine phosphatase [Sphingobacteriales bacterium]|jgi:phosphohistidine phosphatase